MKKITTGILFFIALISQAQELNYGITLGGNLYEIYANSALNPSNSTIRNEAGTKKFKLYVGGFADYGFTKNIGAKALIAFNQKTLAAGEVVDFSFLDISPSLKYSFGENYNDGFYLLIGPRFSFLLNAEFNGEDVKDNFENSNIGFQLGAGTSIYEFLELELRLDYGLTALYDVLGNDRKIFGGILALNLNLEKLLNK
ncbi:porin family protein [Lacinutrix sp. Bg11-31]|uniref:porin family protein n=1 Tax=Lacinutrix sp. Bg11-31 TaxID=2057808 RepID=UPI0012FDAD80|nr:porin family protein [Lacinutrix sp. Bg11-31]